MLQHANEDNNSRPASAGVPSALDSTGSAEYGLGVRRRSGVQPRQYGRWLGLMDSQSVVCGFESLGPTCSESAQVPLGPRIWGLRPSGQVPLISH